MTSSPLTPVTIESAAPRSYAQVAGRIVWVQVEPSDAPPQLTARVEDATGRIDAVFMGRRTIPGIEPGREVVLEGRVSDAQVIATMFNPRYTLVSKA
jgi:RecG-like helicase